MATFPYTILFLLITTPLVAPNVQIFGGKTAQPGQFPFMVSINVKNFGHLSGGSIFNIYGWVITAAHSMADWFPENLTVLAGTNFLNTGGILYNVSTIIIHPNYNQSVATDDIALVKIDGTFDFGPLIKNIGLAAVGNNNSVSVIGWGSTEDTESPNELRFTEERTLSDQECTTLSQGGQYVFDLVPGQVCAIGTVATGACYGDSGGPLIRNDALVGIVSYGVKPCAQGYPEVFTRVDYYWDWITTNIVDN